MTRRFRAALEALPDALVLFEPIRSDPPTGPITDFRHVYLNPRAARLLGVPAGRTAGRSMLEVYPRLRGSAEFARCVEVAESGRPWSFDLATRPGPAGLRLRGQVVQVEDGCAVCFRSAGDLPELREAQGLARIGGWHWDPGTGTFTASPELFRLVGLDPTAPEPVTARELYRMMDARDVRRLRAIRDQVLRDRRPFTADQRLAHPDGTVQHLTIRGEAVLDDEGRAVGVRGTVQDVTEQRRSESALRESEERFRLAFDESLLGAALVVVDPTGVGPVLRVNGRLCGLLGRTADELIGTGMWDVLPVHEDDRPVARARLDQLVSGGGDTSQAQVRLRRTDGGTSWVTIGQVLVRDGDGVPLYVLTQVEDITARRAAEHELRRQARHDDLTGLPNRVCLLDHLQTVLDTSGPEPHAVGVLFLDVDDFKTVNDSLGHEAGDGLLRSVADLLRGVLKPGDFVARLGGDEFVLVCGDAEDTTEALTLAALVQAALAREITVGVHQVRMTVSIGVAIGGPESSPSDLLRDADMAMYRAKAAGKDRWALADLTAHAGAMRRLTMESALRRAVSRDELRLHYQPVIDLVSGVVVGVEALLRWQHPERGLLRPEVFLDILEGSSLIVPIGEWALDAACAQAARWRRDHGRHAPLVAVNVSARQLGRAELHRRVGAALARHGLPPEALCIELTEREAIATSGEQAQDCDRLHDAGVLLAVDDFGTGYAGLDYLRRFPVDILKIDRSLVARLDRDPTDTAITAGLVTLGRSLGLTVVAEGVESVVQRDSLIALGCPQGQGALWSAAVSADLIDSRLGESAAVPAGRTG